MRAFDEHFREVLLQTEDLEWVEKSLAGLSHKMLWRDEETEASIALVRFEKGSGIPSAAPARVEPVHVLPVRAVRVPADRHHPDQGQLLLEPQGRRCTDRRWPRRPLSCSRCTTGRTTRSGRRSTTTTRTLADMAGWDVHTHLIPPTVLAAARRGEFGLSVDDGSLVVDGRDRLPLQRLANPSRAARLGRRAGVGRRGGVGAACAVPLRPGRRLGCPGEPGAPASSPAPQLRVLGQLPLLVPAVADVAAGLAGEGVFSGFALGTRVRFARRWTRCGRCCDAAEAFTLIHPGHSQDSDSRPTTCRTCWEIPMRPRLAAAGLVFADVAGRFPGIRFCLCHGGGVTAALAGRWQRGIDTARPGIEPPRCPWPRPCGSSTWTTWCTTPQYWRCWGRRSEPIGCWPGVTGRSRWAANESIQAGRPLGRRCPNGSPGR